MSPIPTFIDIPGYGPVSLTVFVYGAVAVWIAAWIFSYRDGTALGNDRNRYRKDLYSPHTTWFLGSLPFVLATRHKSLETWGEERAKMDRNPEHHGKWLSWSAPYGRRIIDISRPDLIEYVQKTNFQNYVKGKQFYLNMEAVLGDGIFNVDGHAWTLQRKATSKIFNGNAFRGIIAQSIDKNIERLVTIIKRHADQGEVFDLSQLFFRFTLESFGGMAFGCDIGALSTETDEPVPFTAAFDYAQVVLNKRFQDPFWPINEFLDGSRGKMRDTVRILDEFCYNLIDERTRAGRNTFTSEKKHDSQTDLLSLYMNIRDEQGKPMSRKQLRDAVLNLIIAGRDTTAQATSWTMIRLLRDPKWIESIRKEADEMGHLEYDTFKHLHMTNAVFMEGLRLSPSVPKNGWQAVKDDQLPNGGPFIRGGEYVHWGDYSMAREESIWGPDAKQFNPARWIDADGTVKKMSNYKAHMFNAGYRLCLGMELAKFEGCHLLTAILKKFDLEFAEGYWENTPKLDTEDMPKYLPSLTLHLANPLMVRATVRKSA
ncbi:BQ5605_C021g09279 [Microbotryum silenes-dioicae]|uniref:BQ5605_C021g09279 protein n=1 Tax=Microbotryum silenes-dioicae TaxID=796604 RepID=A0A2X0MMR3_9BASI|nr:BQ5605_C021g09279 [Microbotryum silenes-dioicae]